MTCEKSGKKTAQKLHTHARRPDSFARPTAPPLPVVLRAPARRSAPTPLQVRRRASLPPALSSERPRPTLRSPRHAAARPTPARRRPCRRQPPAAGPNLGTEVPLTQIKIGQLGRGRPNMGNFIN
ncbi:hypothetical protein ZWY2020_017690 [Hordeum vulgare]|nr:hypothetical protein ZWY2020_017690 [Hordeum vulgare]